MASAPRAHLPPRAPPKSLTFWQNLLAGGVAGITEVCIMYPLDVVKTRAQLSSGRVSLFSELVALAKGSGLGMYRGILPPILVEAPKRAVKFASNAAYKPMFSNSTGQLGVMGALAAGVCAGFTEALVIVPFDLVKIRLQAKENIGLYKNSMDAVLKIFRSEGPLAFYTGLESTLWRNAIWNGAYFSSIFVLRRELPQADTEVGNLARNFFTGAIGGTLATTFNTPADVVKTRIQNQYAELKPGETPKYTWTLSAARIIVREEGIGALYKGYAPKVLRLGPGGGILLVVYTWVSGLFEE